MAFLLENPLPIYAVGAVLMTFCGLVFLARRNVPSLLALGGAVLLTLILVVVELVVITDGEQIEAVAVALMAALEENDMPGVLAHIDPASTQVCSDTETLMPLVQVADTSASLVKVEVYESLQPLVAASEFQAKVDGVHTRSGIRLFYFDRVFVSWVKKEGRWLLTGYTSLYDGRPISAVKSVRNNRPVSH
ncbi:MAG: hypothetical protein MI725_12345 [Pirellulales bacterium]|nr:hypothetical protein [Pirellulales bacterium]